MMVAVDNMLICAIQEDHTNAVQFACTQEQLQVRVSALIVSRAYYAILSNKLCSSITGPCLQT